MRHGLERSARLRVIPRFVVERERARPISCEPEFRRPGDRVEEARGQRIDRHEFPPAEQFEIADVLRRYGLERNAVARVHAGPIIEPNAGRRDRVILIGRPTLEPERGILRRRVEREVVGDREDEKNPDPKPSLAPIEWGVEHQGHAPVEQHEAEQGARHDEVAIESGGVSDGIDESPVDLPDEPEVGRWKEEEDQDDAEREQDGERDDHTKTELADPHCPQ